MADEGLTAAYDFALPEELIAQHPVEPRDAARVMVVRGEQIEHRRFAELSELLRPSDLLVLNETRVIRARLHGRREPGGGACEIFLLHPEPAGPGRWAALVRPAKKLRLGTRVRFDDGSSAEIAGMGEEGERIVELHLIQPLVSFLREVGDVPLPPYVHERVPEEEYQTVYARVEGSVAAPTAGLHFTPELLERIEGRGIETARLVLDVGLGTFRPMAAQRLAEHRMHAERYEIPQATVEAVARAKREGRRVVAVGTTTLRALEGCMHDRGALRAGPGETSIFITPEWRFAVVDALVTNFHLPRSTLLVLVSAFAGRERMLHAYEQAVVQRYRFYSFGDAMLLERA
ncbi:MAG TPA: tRNA preQ1(34) S-adenosylmethionine ribosyltransferase-isomerase QueA [Candidatus Dormibacteraeota bacterium]|nr:tRNA preQ1(34) S-adenosylmethionine ribosyltransferase-isomerase QueA [Candidatus Dormibacteraeota bacterium]